MKIRWFLPNGPIKNKAAFGSDNGFMSSRQQTVFWKKNDDLIDWYIDIDDCAALDLDELISQCYKHKTCILAKDNDTGCVSYNSKVKR